MSMNQPHSAEQAENQADLTEGLRRESMGITSKLSREDVIASATDQFVKVATEQDTDEESIAELLDKLPKRVLKRVEREYG